MSRMIYRSVLCLTKESRSPSTSQTHDSGRITFGTRKGTRSSCKEMDHIACVTQADNSPQVNRLTRELSMLRQQTASVVSNSSSTSVGDSVIPTSARRHRSSSNLSTRSITAVTTGTTSVSGVAPARDSSIAGSTRPSMDLQRPSLSRESSVGTPRLPVNASPSVPSMSHRQSITSQPSAPTDYTQHPRSPSFSTAVAAARYEEAAYHRAELEIVKRENEALKQRIRELERSLARRSSLESTDSRERSGSSADRT